MITLRELFDRDLDQVFAYRSTKMVRIRDYKVCGIEILFSLLVLFYVLIYVFVMWEGYYAYESGHGNIITYKSGTSYSVIDNGEGQDPSVRVWDKVDLIYPPQESSALTVATYIEETPLEKRGICKDISRLCNSDKECFAGRCESGHWMEPTWCSEEETTQHKLKGIEDMLLWFTSDIYFSQLAPDDKFSSHGSSYPKLYPHKEVNTFRLGDLLAKAGIKLEKIHETGAVIRLRYKWECNFTWHYDCSPDLEIERVDNVAHGKPNGFHYTRTFSYKQDGQWYRDKWKVYGVRILLTSQGVANKFSPHMIVLNLSTGVALYRLTKIVADFVMLYWMANRSDYRSYKIEVTTNLEGELQKRQEKERKISEMKAAEEAEPFLSVNVQDEFKS